MTSIAVIGQGFVGGSLSAVFAERGVDVWTYDRAHKKATSPGPGRIGAAFTLEDLVAQYESEDSCSRVYFICLPTPMRQDRRADITAIKKTLDVLARIKGERIAVIKSTVPPGTTEALNKDLVGSDVTCIFNPEFLTEANALDDMRNQNRIILGGPRPWINRVKSIYQTSFPRVPIIKTSSTVAEMVKYFTNVHLAARVILSCEMYEVCEALDRRGYNVDYDKVVEYAKHDTRLGGSHMNVPGNDGIPGARGHCFPKDLAALISVAHDVDIVPLVMEALWTKNLAVVPPSERDWERMPGRAVVA